MRTGACFGSSLIISDRSVIKMKKLFLLLAFMVCGLASNVFAEQITKFAVVDTEHPYIDYIQKLRKKYKKESYTTLFSKIVNKIKYKYNTK